jgi:hypothetical protein
LVLALAQVTHAIGLLDDLLAYGFCSCDWCGV